VCDVLRNPNKHEFSTDDSSFSAPSPYYSTYAHLGGSGSLSDFFWGSFVGNGVTGGCCDPGWGVAYEMFIEIEENSCADSPCTNGGTCVTTSNGFNCSCPVGYSGLWCGDNDSCEKLPCQNGGTCTPSGGSYTCTCPLRFFGQNCEWQQIVHSLGNINHDASDYNTGTNFPISNYNDNWIVPAAGSAFAWNSIIRVDMGGGTYYFKPEQGHTLFSMLRADDLHEYSSTPSNFQAVTPYAQFDHLGGNDVLTIPFWGSNNGGIAGGCCFPSWSSPFNMSAAQF
jgi:hypothetical protein